MTDKQERISLSLDDIKVESFEALTELTSLPAGSIHGLSGANSGGCEPTCGSLCSIASGCETVCGTETCELTICGPIMC